MAGIIGIYGLVVSMIIQTKVKRASENYGLFNGFAHLGAGLVVGLCGLGAGYAIGIVGDSGVRANAQQPRLYVGMILILIFAEVGAHSNNQAHYMAPTNKQLQVLGLYGMIVALILATMN